LEKYHSAQAIQGLAHSESQPGAFASAVGASGVALFVVFLVGVAAQTDNLIAGYLPSPTWVAWWIRIGVGLAAIPILFYGWGIWCYMRGRLEADLYRVTGWRVDLDGDGETGESESQQTPHAGHSQQQPSIRLVHEYQDKPVADPPLELPDGRQMLQSEVVYFIRRSKVIGLGIVKWKQEAGWAQPKWELARDFLAEFKIAEPRRDGIAGHFLMSQEDALEKLGITLI